MKLIVAGSRSLHCTDTVRQGILEQIDLSLVNEIVSGGAPGVDTIARDLAKEFGKSFKEFPANWSMGKMAGPARNIRMAHYADALIAFPLPTSAGTYHMIEVAMELGLECIVIPAQAPPQEDPF